MDTEDQVSHYQFLDVDMSASAADVEAALARRASEADSLAFIDPARAQWQWERIRAIQRDLLAGPDRRYAYDRVLLSLIAVDAPQDRVEPEPAVTLPREHALQPWLLILPALLVLAALLLMIVPLRLEEPVASPVPVLHPPSFAHGVASGRLVQLAWQPVRRATLYRLQIATSPIDPSDPVVFAHGGVTITTRNVWYVFRVLGPQLYYWRVRALVPAGWSVFSHSQHFNVVAPHVAAPVLRRPAPRAVVHARTISLCWSPLHGAYSYVVRLDGRVEVVRPVCVRHPVRVGTHRWSVAARVRAAMVLVGPFAPSRQFTVAARLTPTATPQPTASPQPSATPRPMSMPPPGTSIQFFPPIACSGHAATRPTTLRCSGGVSGVVGGRPFSIEIQRGSLQRIASGGAVGVLSGVGTWGVTPATFAITATDLDPGMDTVQMQVWSGGQSHLSHWTCTPGSHRPCIEIQVAG